MNDTSGNQTSELKNAGLKATAARLRILELFQKRAEEKNGERRHISAEDLYKELVSTGVDIGLATVYRVLAQFEQAGLIVRHHFDTDRATYELEDGGHHDHLVCLQCGKVVEFVAPSIEKEQSPSAMGTSSATIRWCSTDFARTAARKVRADAASVGAQALSGPS